MSPEALGTLEVLDIMEGTLICLGGLGGSYNEIPLLYQYVTTEMCLRASLISERLQTAANAHVGKRNRASNHEPRTQDLRRTPECDPEAVTEAV